MTTHELKISGGSGMAGRYAANAVRHLAAFCAQDDPRGLAVAGAVSPALQAAALQMRAALDELAGRGVSAVVFMDMVAAGTRDGSAPAGAGSPAPTSPAPEDPAP